MTETPGFIVIQRGSQQRGWVDGGHFPDHPWREPLQRSAHTLKGLTYAPTGALLAARTTSLPEHLGAQRNWDYRYAWVRDSGWRCGRCTPSASTKRPTTSWPFSAM
jgi:GH15 family glucan-1,4-alpha-glucosidase